jgi:hypothetical protein
MIPGDEDRLLAELRTLPGATLDVRAEARTLAAAQRALAASTTLRHPWARWLSAEVLIPAVLCLGGIVYAAGALQTLARVYGAPEAEDRYSLGDGGGDGRSMGGSDESTPLVFVVRP